MPSPINSKSTPSGIPTPAQGTTVQNATPPTESQENMRKMTAELRSHLYAADRDRLKALMSLKDQPVSHPSTGVEMPARQEASDHVVIEQLEQLRREE